MADLTMYTPGPWEPKIMTTFTDKGVAYFISAGPLGEIIATNVKKDNVRLIAAAPNLFKALKYMNHMGGDERGGYCICPCKDGSAPDHRHATVCANARQAIAKAEGQTT